jgi:hypothetical protein
MIVNESECKAAGLDVKEVERIARGLSHYAQQAEKLGLQVFGGGGIGSLRTHPGIGVGSLIVADLHGVFDGGDGATRDADVYKQLMRLFKDAERLNFWQAHDWYKGERNSEGEWTFFDADGNSCKGETLRKALDTLMVIQPDLRNQMDDDEAWEG